MKYEYFVSYFYATNDGNTGEGNTTFDCRSEVNGYDYIEAMQNQIKENSAFKEVCIRNFILLKVNEETETGEK